MSYQFSTLDTAHLLDALVEAVDAARETASVSPSWLRAIDSAYDYLLQTESIQYDLTACAIRVESATTPGTFYESNGDCQCAAFTKGKGICWHRAAARLVRRALECQVVLPDGTPVTPFYDLDGTPIVVNANGSGYSVSLDVDGYIGLEVGRISLDGVRLDDLLNFRSWLTSGAIESMVVAANVQMGAALSA